MDTSVLLYNELQRHKGQTLALHLSGGRTCKGLIVAFCIADVEDGSSRYPRWQIVPATEALGAGIDLFGLDTGEWVEHAAIVKVTFQDDTEILCIQTQVP